MSFVLLSVHWRACFDITRYSYLLEDGRNTANMLELLHKRVVALGHQHVVFVLHSKQRGGLHTKGGLRHHDFEKEPYIIVSRPSLIFKL